MRFRIILILFILSFYLIQCSKGKKDEGLTPAAPQEYLSKGDKLMKDHKYQEALESYGNLLIHFPTSDLHIDAQLKMASALEKLQRYEDQSQLLLRLLRENIIPERVPEIYVQLGRLMENFASFNPGIFSTDTTDYLEALQYYKKASNYEDSELTAAKAEALYRSGLVSAKIGEFEEATAFYQKVILLYPESELVSLAKIKVQNPQDTSELELTEAQLAAADEAKTKAEEKATPESVTEQPGTEDDGNMDNLIPESNETTEPQYEAPADSSTTPQMEPENSESENETPAEESVPATDDNTAPADSSAQAE